MIHIKNKTSIYNGIIIVFRTERASTAVVYTLCIKKIPKSIIAAHHIIVYRYTDGTSLRLIGGFIRFLSTPLTWSGRIICLPVTLFSTTTTTAPRR